ncbi:MAG: DUF6150 family protein [Bacteroidota bacterium]
MKALIPVFLLVLTLTGFKPNDQQNQFCRLYGVVYVEESRAFADHLVFEMDTEAFADLVVFDEENRLFADRSGIWHFTDNRDFADFTIYFTESRDQADFSIYFTETASFAGCRD